MTVTVYRSDDASAPVLEGTAGALITVLDAILVNGYGAKAAAGWAKEFSGTNKAVYRAATGNRMRLRIDDTGTQEARAVGYESMSDVDTGTGPFPTAAQLSGGMFVRKSSTADGTDRPWICFADVDCFYLFTFCGQATIGLTTNTDAGLGFGDFTSNLPGDTYNSFIMASAATGATVSRMAEQVAPAAALVTSTVGLYCPRAHTAVSGAIKLARLGRNSIRAGMQALGGDATIATTYPDPIAGGLLVSPVDLWEETSSSFFSRRGYLKGYWEPLHEAPGAHFDTFSGAGDLSGRSFFLITAYNATNPGRLAMETSDTW